ncbi:MAG: enoyl-CoA hydratase-related protein [Bacteroidota bacterium]
MPNTFETLLFEQEESGIALLTINRPASLNALSKMVFDELDAALDVVSNDHSVKALIITGAGEKAFVAGADIKQLSGLSAEEATQTSANGQRVFQRIEDMEIPVVAAVNGYALGGGCELAMACHLRFASQNAVLGLPEVSLGLIPGWGGTQRLPKLVGQAKAIELVISGNFVKADQAERIGLVNAVAEDHVVEYARTFLGKVLKQGPVAVKTAINAIQSAGGEEGFEAEANAFGELFGTDDFKEGTEAFIEKRKPQFVGK